jgi:hypothetical protein
MESLRSIKEVAENVFLSTNPDIFNAFTLPVFSPRAISLGRPVTVHGHASGSNAASHLLKDGKSLYQRFLLEYGEYKMAELLPPVSALADCTYSEIVNARVV